MGLLISGGDTLPWFFMFFMLLRLDIDIGNQAVVNVWISGLNFVEWLFRSLFAINPNC